MNTKKDAINLCIMYMKKKKKIEKFNKNIFILINYNFDRVHP